MRWLTRLGSPIAMYLAAAGIERAQRLEIVIGEEAAAVGGAVERQVVDHQQRARAMALDVEFHPGRAERDAGVDRQQGVFRRMTASAAVADDQGQGLRLTLGALGTFGAFFFALRRL